VYAQAIVGLEPAQASPTHAPIVLSGWTAPSSPRWRCAPRQHPPDTPGPGQARGPTPTESRCPVHTPYIHHTPARRPVPATGLQQPARRRPPSTPSSTQRPSNRPQRLITDWERDSSLSVRRLNLRCIDDARRRPLATPDISPTGDLRARAAGSKPIQAFSKPISVRPV